MFKYDPNWSDQLVSIEFKYDPNWSHCQSKIGLFRAFGVFRGPPSSIHFISFTCPIKTSTPRRHGPKAQSGFLEHEAPEITMCRAEHLFLLRLLRCLLLESLFGCIPATWAALR